MPGFQDFVLPFGGGTNVQYAGPAAQAYGQLGSAYPQALSGLYGSASNAFGGYGQALTGLGNTYGQNYGSYANTMGNMAQAYANQASNRYSSNAMAEAARQGAAGNIGSAALGAYGNIGGQALQAWAQNQASYNNALQGMFGANQYATSQLGQSRNAALAGLGNSYASAAAGLAPSTMASNLNFNFSDGGGGGMGGGGGYSSTGPNGPISSGSYGGVSGGGPGGMNFTGSRVNTPGSMDAIINPTYRGLDNLSAGLNDQSALNALQDNNAAGMSQLDAQHYSSRAMPSQMMQQGLSGLQGLGAQGYGQLNHGMNQFYANQNAAFDPNYFSGFGRELGNRYDTANGQVGGVLGALTSGWGDNKSQFGSSSDMLKQMYGDANAAPTPRGPTLAEQQAQARRDYNTKSMDGLDKFWKSPSASDLAWRKKAFGY